MSLLRYLAAGLAHRWGGFPRSENVRVAVGAVLLFVAGVAAWNAAANPGGPGACAVERPRQGKRVSFDNPLAGPVATTPAESSAKVTFESRPTAGASGAAPVAVDPYDVRPEASIVRGGHSGNAVPRFRHYGARGASSKAGGPAVGL